LACTGSDPHTLRPLEGARRMAPQRHMPDPANALSAARLAILFFGLIAIVGSPADWVLWVTCFSLETKISAILPR
jgi:hypothetical protein